MSRRLIGERKLDAKPPRHRVGLEALKPVTSHDTILVTGGAGFIGSHTVDALLRHGPKVWVLDNLSTGSLRNLKQWRTSTRLNVIKGDVRNSSVVAKDCRGEAGKCTQP